MFGEIVSLFRENWCYNVQSKEKFNAHKKSQSKEKLDFWSFEMFAFVITIKRLNIITININTWFTHFSSSESIKRWFTCAIYFNRIINSVICCYFNRIIILAQHFWVLVLLRCHKGFKFKHSNIITNIYLISSNFRIFIRLEPFLRRNKEKFYVKQFISNETASNFDDLFRMSPVLLWADEYFNIFSSFCQTFFISRNLFLIERSIFFTKRLKNWTYRRFLSIKKFYFTLFYSFFINFSTVLYEKSNVWYKMS